MRSASETTARDAAHSAIARAPFAHVLFAPDAVVSTSPDVIACALGDGAALLDMRSSSYFSLNPVAAFVWEQLAQPMSVAALVGAVRESFAAQDADIEADMIAMLVTLRAADLVAVHPAPAG